MTEPDVKEKVRVAWFKACLKNPDLAQEHGSDGWKVFENMAESPVQKIAYLFDVSGTSVYRWLRQHKERV